METQENSRNPLCRIMEPLQEIHRDKWPQLLKIFEQDWPLNVVAYCILDTQISNPELSTPFKFRIYAPDGNLEYGMIAMIEMFTYKEVTIHPTKGSRKIIEKALLETNVINWSPEFYISAARDEVVQCLENIKDRKGITLSYNNTNEPPTYMQMLNKDANLYENVSCPPNTYVGSLKLEDIEIVDQSWTYHSAFSHRVLKILMENDLTYVLYSYENKPLAWIVINEFGALSRLFCIEEQRGKGYGELIAKYAVNEWLKKGKVALGFTIDGNYKAENLFRKLNFENVGTVYWVKVNKNK